MSSWHGHTFRITGRLRKKSIDELQHTNGLYACNRKQFQSLCSYKYIYRLLPKRCLRTMIVLVHVGFLWCVQIILGCKSQLTSNTAPGNSSALKTPGHYLTQCLFIISEVQRQSPQDNFIRDASAINFQYQIENFASKYLLFHSHLIGTSGLKPPRDVYVSWLTKLSLLFMITWCHNHDLN